MRLITLFSICLAAICAVAASHLVGGQTLFGYRITGEREGQLIFFIFVITFLLSAASMSATFFRGDSLKARERKQNVYRPARPVPQAPKANAQQKQKAKAKKQREDLDQAMAGSDDFQLADQAEADTSERLKKSLHGEKEAEGGDKDAEAQGRGVVLDADTYGKLADPVETLSPHAEKQKA